MSNPYTQFIEEFSSTPTVHSIDDHFTCQWIGPFGLPCNHIFSGRGTSTHLLERHVIRGPDDMPVRCAWIGCSEEVKKESICRHVQSIHLFIVYPCDTCGQSFSREYALNKHKKSCTEFQQ
ncbi:hypothetical protein M405DRAFT_826034 [Rhizopogon salebrosus TDB-379]|nr:hypothetical protein M405DRAFT_826034 [Rhizopogon salebrosus TDB-379]